MRDSSNAPRAIRVIGTRAQLVAAFPALVPLQPISWTEGGLLCAPHIAPELARDVHPPPGLRFAAPIDPAPAVRVPDVPARMLAGLYRRSPVHLAAPDGVAEVVQCDGEGFGVADHPTTLMCLRALTDLPSRAALDVGCGSGLLSLAWARLHSQRVDAIDRDPRACAQTRASVAASGLTDLVAVRCADISQLAAHDLADRTILANIPVGAHEALVDVVGRSLPPSMAVISGIRHHERHRIETLYRAVGFHARRRWYDGRFVCIVATP